MSKGKNSENYWNDGLKRRETETMDTIDADIPMFDVVVILPDGREAAKVGDEYYLLKRGKPDFNQPVDPEEMEG